MATSVVAFNYDPDLRDAANRAGHNYWHEYVKEICDHLGLTAEAVPRTALADGNLSDRRVILLGSLSGENLPAALPFALCDWVQAGGVLISFATEGLDDLFGNTCASCTPQPSDDFTLAARFSLATHPLTEGIHSDLHPDQKLLIYSHVRIMIPRDSDELARLFDREDNDTGFAAITHRELGKGHAFYFAFDVPKTLWAIQQGRPVDRDYDGDGYHRLSDAMVTRGSNIEVMYADEIIFLLQNMIGVAGIPLIHQLPPKDVEVADALLYWGGDDEGVAGAQVESSRFMKELGLPYHLNIMPRNGEFALTDGEAKEIEGNGHELALHVNFIDGYTHPLHFTRDDIGEQMKLFMQRFGRPSVCSVFHWCLWTGWAEPAIWLSEFGGRADNSRIHAPSPPLNPVNMLGFSFGTAFPFYIYTDHTRGNKRLDFLVEPITAYEVGYSYTDPEATDFDLIHKCLDLACAYHLTLNMFYHPPNVAKRENCRRAIREVLRRIDEKEVTVVHMGNDELCGWWNARTVSSIEDIEIVDGAVRGVANAAHPRGMVIKILLGKRSVADATCDGASAPVKSERKFGQNWAYMVVPQGRHELEVTFSRES
ncbi:MAG: hypothetical protein GXP25_08850 [Planctomycetes bacterium]|nr:hypothetical protein [Planctomycetota bacterium]